MLLFGREHKDEMCPSCAELLLPECDLIRLEMVMPLPAKAGPLSRRKSFKHICYDCATAEGMGPLHGLTFDMARIAVGSERQEMLRLPGQRLGVFMLLPCGEDDLTTLRDWQQKHGLDEEERELVRQDMRMEKERG